MSDKKQQTKAQRDATLPSVTKGPAPAVKYNPMKKMGSSHSGSKKGK
jgi:hypothetical protein